MKLSVGNRLRILAIMPESGNIVTLRVVSETRQKVALSEEEFEKFKVVVTGTRLTWDDKAEPVEIELGPVAKGMIRDALSTLNKENKLTVPDVELWDMFMEEKDESNTTVPDRV